VRLAWKILEKLVFIDSAERKMKYTKQALLILVAAVGLCSLIPQAGCTWGYKQATIPARYSPVPSEQVEILSFPPSRPFKQIGIVSAVGYLSTSETYRKLRKAAADLGADAVIVTHSTAVNMFTYPSSEGAAIKYL
jgi:hypothetical protein